MKTHAVPESDRHLLPDYNAAGEKVAVLRGLLLEHRVDYNPSAKKSELVRLFNQHVKPRAAQLLAERQAVISSSHGIERVSSQEQSQGSSRGKSKRRREPEPDSDRDELASTSDASSAPPPPLQGRPRATPKKTPSGSSRRKVKAEPDAEIVEEPEKEVREARSCVRYDKLTWVDNPDASYCSSPQVFSSCQIQKSRQEA